MLLSQYLLRQPYCKRAQFSAEKENTVHSDPPLLWPRHKFDRKFQWDCSVFLFFISGAWRSWVSRERIQKLSIAFTAEKIQVPNPKLCRMIQQFMICQGLKKRGKLFKARITNKIDSIAAIGKYHQESSSDYQDNTVALV